MIDKIKKLKKFVNSIPATELNEYKLLQERCIAYNEAIDDIVKLFDMPVVSNSEAAAHPDCLHNNTKHEGWEIICLDCGKRWEK